MVTFLVFLPTSYGLHRPALHTLSYGPHRIRRTKIVTSYCLTVPGRHVFWNSALTNSLLGIMPRTLGFALRSFD